MSANEQMLIDSAIQGNADDFGKLVLKYQNRLYSAMVHVVGCPAEAEDVVQEAFIRAFHKLDRFRGNASFYTWLYRIAFNRSIDRRRTRRATRSLDSTIHQVEQQETSDEQSPSHSMEVREQRQRVQRALAELSEGDRAILILREFEECDYATISDMLGLKIGTVRSRLHRARGHLLERLQSLDEQAGHGITRSPKTLA